MNNAATWLKGLASAVIGGVANSVALMIADPANFNLAEGLPRVKAVALTSAILAAAMYLKQSPLPTDSNAVPALKPAVLLPILFAATLACGGGSSISGCAPQRGGVVAPKTVDQGLVYADGSITAATRVTTQLVRGGIVTAHQAEPVYNHLKTASNAMDLAWISYAAGDAVGQKDALDKAKAALDAANLLLTELKKGN